MAQLNFFPKFIPVSQRVICVILFFINFVVRANSGQICERNPPIEKIATFHTTSFHQFLCDTKLFVDNTEFITHIADDNRVISGVEVITFPRRSGKSLNILMIRFFFQIEVFPNNTDVPRETTNSYRFFTTGKFNDEYRKEIKFTPAPRISDPKYKNIVQTHCAKYPVIHIDFKSFRLGSTDTYDMFLMKFGSMIQVTFKSHKYLKAYLTEKVNTAQSTVHRELAENDLKFFLNAIQNELDSRTLINSIEKLSEILKERFSNRKVIILIDEYDQLVNQLFLHDTQFDSKLKQRMLDFYNEFYSSTLTRNECNYDRAIMTGIINFQKSSIFSGLNYVSHYHMYSPIVNQFYGIAVSEANMLFDIYKIDDEGRKKITFFYDGYKYPTRDGKIETFYNTFSIVNYLNNARFKLEPAGYWTESGMIDGHIHNMMMIRSVKSKLEPLLFDDGISVTMSNEFSDDCLNSQYLTFSISDLKSLEQMSNSQSSFETDTPAHANRFLRLLLVTGYLTWNGADTKPPRFVFPNIEVSRHILQRFKIEYQDIFGETYINLAKKLYKFLFDDNLNPVELEQAFIEFTEAKRHRLVPHFSKSDLKNASATEIPPGAVSTIEVNEAYFASILRAAAIWIKSEKKFVAFEHMVGKAKLDLFFHNYKDRQAIIELKYEGSHHNIEDVLSQLGKYYTEYHYEYKFIAILGKIDGSIHVKAQFDRPK